MVLDQYDEYNPSLSSVQEMFIHSEHGNICQLLVPNVIILTCTRVTSPYFFPESSD